MSEFSYAAPADLFVATSMRRNGAVKYQRFDTAADALRFAIEALEPTLLRGTVLEVDEERYDAAAMRALYDSAGYPHPRAPGSPS
ncbi:MAG: hypothetical protein ACKVP4_13815 [Hyphomicrobium sp.]